jgi:hypothetical protein
MGDLAIAAYFFDESPRVRELKRLEFVGVIVRHEFPPLINQLAEQRQADPPFAPFHWEIEFPEVYERENGGFDCIVANPPFLGSSRISEVAGGPIYQQWLKEVVAISKGQVDLSVFFLRHSFKLIRKNGTLGLLATSAIAHGENRIAGLASVSSTGGTIFDATTSKPWPGEASVLVAVVHISKGEVPNTLGTRHLNGTTCDFINSRLQPRAESGEPTALVSNADLAHNGATIRSSGFVLDTAEALILLNKSENGQIVLPLTGGEEVNAPPSKQGKRFAICFGTRTLDEAAIWPELLDIVRARVYPQRMAAKDHGPGAHGKKFWWQYVLRADPLYKAVAALDKCLVMSSVSTYHALRFETTNRVFNHKVYAFAFDSFQAFAVLQSSAHAIWSTMNSSRLGYAINYSTNKTFATFPFPSNWETSSTLEYSGKR